MDNSIANLTISLAVAVVAIAAVAYLVTRTRLFSDALLGKMSWKNTLFIMVVFGLISILGTYASVEVMDAKINWRDLGPMIAGLVGGPVAGIGAGLISGAHRYLMGGGTALACSLATVFAGVFGSIIWYLAGKRFIGVTVAVLFAALQEVFHMALILLLAQPYSYAVAVVEAIWVPMILFNAVGMFVFATILTRLTRGHTVIEGAEGQPS